MIRPSIRVLARPISFILSLSIKARSSKSIGVPIVSRVIGARSLKSDFLMGRVYHTRGAPSSMRKVILQRKARARGRERSRKVAGEGESSPSATPGTWNSGSSGRWGYPGKHPPPYSSVRSRFFFWGVGVVRGLARPAGANASPGWLCGPRGTGANTARRTTLVPGGSLWYTWGVGGGLGPPAPNPARDRAGTQEPEKWRSRKTKHPSEPT